MALSVRCDDFLLNGTTGNQSVSGLGFQPKVIFFTSVIHTSLAHAAASYLCWGVAASSTQRAVVNSYDADGAGTSNSESNARDDRCIYVAVTGANYMNVDFVSMDADGFTINVVSVFDATQRYVAYYALGGSDISNVKVGTFDLLTTDTTSKAVTGVGFQPDMVMLLGSLASNAWPLALSPHWSMALGVASSTTKQYALSTTSLDNQGTTAVSGWDKSGSLYLQASGGTPAIDAEASLSSFDGDGFTLSIANAVDANTRLAYLAIEGSALWSVGRAQVPRANGVYEHVTGCGFQPSGMMFFGGCMSPDGTPASQGGSGTARPFTGFWDGTREKYMSCVMSDNFGTSDTARRHGNASIHREDAAGNTEMEMLARQWDQNGLTLLRNSGTDTAGAQHGYLAVGAAGSEYTDIYPPRPAAVMPVMMGTR